MVYKGLTNWNYGHGLNSIIIFEHELKENSIVIEDSYRLTHLHEILKAKANKTYNLTVLNHGLTSASLIELTANKAVFTKPEKFEKVITPEWHVIVGLSRPPTMKKVLEHATSLGVKHFHFLPAALSEKSYASSKLWQTENATKCLLDGLAQSATYWELPQISHYNSLKQLPDFSSFDKRILSLEPNAQKLSPLQSTTKLVLAFGPERGWTKAEDELLRLQGFTPVHIGRSVLRVEIAMFATLGQCHLMLG